MKAPYDSRKSGTRGTSGNRWKFRHLRQVEAGPPLATARSTFMSLHSPSDAPVDPASRRRALGILVNSTIALIGGALGTLLGVFALGPPAVARERWVRAARLTDLTAGLPVPRVLSVSRADGWYRERARQTVFLVWDGGRDVKALSATCTHLGCQVRWDLDSKQFHCPCHGGVYDVEGRVVEGPPPRPLDPIDVRLDAADGSVLVRL
jgi:nitrite reductase/ring-hydroxylating ferredoxin subunit